VLGNGGVPLSTRESPVLSQATVGQLHDTLKAWFGLELRDGYREVGSAPWPAMRVVAGQSASGAPRFLARIAELAPPAPRLLTGHAHVAMVDPARYEIRVADAGGRLLRIVRVHRDPIPFTSEERDAILAADAAFVPPGPVTVPRVAEDRPVAEHRPRFGSVNFGEDDDLWVWDYEPTPLAGSGRPERVTIFAVDGTPVARLEARPDPLWGAGRRHGGRWFRAARCGRRQFLTNGRLAGGNAIGADVVRHLDSGVAPEMKDRIP
jgi:hypothetical protein